MRVIVTSIMKTPFGDLQQIIQNLHGAGFTLEDMEKIKKSPEIARAMHASFEAATVEYGQRFDWYQRSPEQQLKFACELNRRRHWGFFPEDFPPVPKVVHLLPSEVLSLAIYLPKKGRQEGLRRTIKELWKATPQKIGSFSKTKLQSFSYPYFELIEMWGPWESGIRWVIIDLASYVDEYPGEVRFTQLHRDNSYEMAGVELFSLLMLQPEWLRSWDGTTFFEPFLSGLFSYMDSDKYCDSELILSFRREEGHRSFAVYYELPTIRYPEKASPRFRKC